MKRTLLGFHVSISESIDLAVDRAVEADCTAFQIFTRNPRVWKYKPLKEEETARFVEKRKKARLREGRVPHAVPPEPLVLE